MKHLLIPIDGSDRSIQSIELVKGLFSTGQVDVTLITVCEEFDSIRSEYEMEEARNELMPMLDGIADMLPGFRVTKHVSFGRAGNSILEYAEENGTDIIVVTKSAHPGLSIFIGSVAVYLVKYAKCVVIIAPEKFRQ